eukprot:971659-Pleurochrysis_carterae.AAC.2
MKRPGSKNEERPESTRHARGCQIHLNARWRHVLLEEADVVLDGEDAVPGVNGDDSADFPRAVAAVVGVDHVANRVRVEGVRQLDGHLTKYG